MEAIYKAILQREAREAIERQRDAMTTALFSNPNWDDAKANRTEKLQEMNDQFNHAIELIYYPERADADDIDWDKPFYAAAKRGLERTRQKYAWATEGKTMQQIIEPKDEDQLRARDESRKGIDQA